MQQTDDTMLREVTRRVGKPPRWLSPLRWRHGRSGPPPWLTPADLVSRIYENQDRILRDGRVRWASVVHANSMLFRPGGGDAGAQVVYSRGGDLALRGLQEIAARAYALKGTRPTDPAERRLADMLTDEMERALDWHVPETLAGGHDVVTTVVVLPRQHMPGGFLGMTYFPILADPATALAVLVPARYWPDEFRREWQANTDAEFRRLEATPPVALTPAAAAQAREYAVEQGTADFWIRVGVKRNPQTRGFDYVLDVTASPPDPRVDTMHEFHGVRVAVDRESRPYLEGTRVDYRDDENGAGFVFDNPNA